MVEFRESRYLGMDCVLLVQNPKSSMFVFCTYICPHFFSCQINTFFQFNMTRFLAMIKLSMFDLKKFLLSEGGGGQQFWPLSL